MSQPPPKQENSAAPDINDIEKQITEARQKLEQASASLNSILGKGSGNQFRQYGSATPTALELYKVYREYRVSEHQIINNRLTWFLTIQGFLFAGYGFTAQKFAEVQQKFSADGGHADFIFAFFSSVTPKLDNHLNDVGILQLREVVSLISILGACLSVIALVALFAATRTLIKIQTLWESKVEGNPLYAIPQLPSPAGGGSILGRRLGLTFPFLIPISLGVTWALIFFRLLTNKLLTW